MFAFFKTEGGKPLNKETDAEKQKALNDFRGAVKAANITSAYFDTSERLQVELLLAIFESFRPSQSNRFLSVHGR